MTLTNKKSSCLALIKSHYPQLTSKEKRIADFVLTNDDVIYKTVTEIVKLTGSSYGSIDRFCKKLDYSGFQDLKIQLAEAFATQREQQGEKDSEDFLQRAASQAIQEIQNTVQLQSPETINNAANAIVNSDFVLVAGLSSSAGNAIGIDYRLARFGIRSLVAIDNHMQRHRAATMKKSDVAFLISFSGSTKEIIATGEIAKESRATIIGLTNHLESPVSELSNIKLVTGIESDPLGAEIASRVAVDFLITVIFERIEQLMKKSRSTLAKTFNATADRQL